MTNTTYFLLVAALGIWAALGVLYIIATPELERHARRNLFLGGPIAWLAFVIFAAVAHIQEWKEKHNG